MLLVFKGDTATRDTFRFLEEKLSAGLWSWNIDSSKMSWSVGLFKLLGFEPHSIAPSFDFFARLVVPEDRKLLMELENLARRGLEFERTFRVKRQDGRIRTFHAQGETLTAQGTDEPLAIGVISDTTASAATSLLRDDLSIRYQALVQASGGTAWVIRKDGWALERDGAEALHEDPDQSLGYAWRDRVHPDDVASVNKAISDAVAKNGGFQIEHRTKQPDGSYMWLRSCGVPIRTVNGEVRQFAGLTTSIQSERSLPEQSPRSNEIITGAQIRAARGLINWSVQDLSEASGVSASTIRRFESADSFCSGNFGEEVAIKQALQKGGTKFYFHQGAKPAVAPR